MFRVSRSAFAEYWQSFYWLGAANFRYAFYEQVRKGMRQGEEPDCRKRGVSKTMARQTEDGS